MNTNHNLAEEKISKLILKFSIPCITSMPVSSLYNIVDQIFVGRGNDFIPYGWICHKCSVGYHPAKISWGYRGSVLRPHCRHGYIYCNSSYHDTHNEKTENSKPIRQQKAGKTELPALILSF